VGFERGGDDVAMTDQHWSSTQNKDLRGTTERGQTEALRRVPLSRILGSDREIVIEFNGADYRLRITRNQKLILTK
jgi:hemin uptake protein HemP